MTPLGRRIAELVGAAGPIPVSEYMALCLSDPRDGYYTSREPFGVAGDFTTAPEISQMFGELVAAWLATAWAMLGRPASPVVAEIGPGRGTLMRDMVRTLGKVAPDLRAGAAFHLVETSPRLQRVQAATLAGSGEFHWHADIDELPSGPLFTVGNEIFDALPVRQYQFVGGIWRERMVGRGEGDTLGFVLGEGSLDPAFLPAGLAPDEGAVFEVSPARTAMMQAIARRLAAGGGCGLFFDYGHLRPGFGDTLQAVRRHRPEDVLANPGEADVTTHVDFAALAEAARMEGLEPRLTTQGAFLLDLGLLERAGRLGAGLDEAGREALRGQAERLAGPDQMGSLFKVLAVGPTGKDLPAFTAR